MSKGKGGGNQQMNGGPAGKATKGAKNKSNGKKRVTPKQPSARVRRILKAREPKIIEGPKNALLLKGTKCPELLQTLLRDLTKLLKPNAKMLNRKNEIRPFEDATSLEFLMNKNDSGLFAFSNHSKKRPQNLILGRTYDKHILDMVEFEVSSVAPLESFKGAEKKRLGSKPCILFTGEGWEQDATLERIKSLFIDLFRVEDVDKIALAGIDCVSAFTALGESILVRNYHIRYKKSSSRVPKVQLEPMGPCFTLTIRRHQLAAPDLWKAALKQPKQLKTKKVKNESHNTFGDKIGRIHVGRQDIDAMPVKRMKALRKSKDGDEEAKEEDGEGMEVDEVEEEEEDEEFDGSEEDDEEEDEEEYSEEEV